MQYDSKIRDARMMEAAAGLGGRCAMASEVDLRLGLVPRIGDRPGWITALAKLLNPQGRARSVGLVAGSPEAERLEAARQGRRANVLVVGQLISPDRATVCRRESRRAPDGRGR